MYVASVCSKCFIYFSDSCCKCVYLDVSYVSHICCKCFIWMLNMLCNGYSSVSGFFCSVSDACFKCFMCLQTYVANVSSGCFKSKLGVVSPSLPRCLLLPASAGYPLPHPCLSVLQAILLVATVLKLKSLASARLRDRPASRM
jgi:hypothetical protein